MKQRKHSKGFVVNQINNEDDVDIVSSSSKKRSKKRDKSKDIVSKTPKSKKFFDFLTKLLFVFEMLVVIALIIHATIVQIFPVQYIFILIAVLGILAGIHMWLLSGKRRWFKRKRTISLLLSIAMFVVSAFGMSYMGILDSAIGDIVVGGEENEDQVDNISKHPFVIYLSGLDTRKKGEIAEKGLSDVNMVIAVNPQTKKVLMLSTPRDYYVGIEGDPNKLDKLTHAGNKGIECSMKTLEALYDIEFNYYAKVNFKSVYDIVNAVGGVTVNSDYYFTSRYSYSGRTYTFQKGENKLTGDSALAFARERKSFANGDRQRGIHQQVVIKAVIEKAISPSILIPSNIESMVKAISSNTKTNFSASEIKKLISYQMGTMKEPWSFESLSVDGTGDYAYTYSYPGQALYVMRPDMETVENAKKAIQAVLSGEEVLSDSSTVSSTAN